MSGDSLPDGVPQLPRRRTHARRESDSLVPPREKPRAGDVERDAWISKVCTGFVAPGLTNKQYYKVVLETLWPPGHGIPGPYVTEDELREAINRYRKENRVGRDPARSYLDVFRRVRELQGEEGVVGIIKQGRTYQLVDLELAPKRIPRTALGDEEWVQVLSTYENKCAICGQQPPDVQLEQDHKIPRLRGGGDEIENWQPLCTECNNHKSIRCRNCQLDCTKCPWAFPEVLAPFNLSRQSIEGIRAMARELGVDPHCLANKAIEEYLSRHT